MKLVANYGTDIFIWKTGNEEKLGVKIMIILMRFQALILHKTKYSHLHLTSNFLQQQCHLYLSSKIPSSWNFTPCMHAIIKASHTSCYHPDNL